MMQPQPGGMPMPRIEEIPEILARYTAAQIEGEPILRYLRDRLTRRPE